MFTTFASGAFAAADLIPLSIPAVEEYISLLPMVWPLVAVKTKYEDPDGEARYEEPGRSRVTMPSLEAAP